MAENEQAEATESNPSAGTAIQAVKPASGVPSAVVGKMGMEVGNLEAMWWLANRVVQSGLAPKDCDNAADAMIRMQMGMEIGLKPMQAVQNIANINGRPSVWGPVVKGLVLNSKLCENWVEEWIGAEPGQELKLGDTWKVTAKRVGLPDQTFTFTVAEAKKAGLLGKKGPWQQYPKDMLLYRARGRCIKSLFPDVQGGLGFAEEMNDLEPPRDITAEVEVSDAEPTKSKPLQDVVRKAQEAEAARQKEKAKGNTQPAPEAPQSEEGPPWEESKEPDVEFPVPGEADGQTELS